MRILAQRVRSASVTVDGTVTGSIGQGLLIFLGVGPEDTEQIAEKMAEKLMRLRIFSDQQDKINLSVQDVSGSLLVVSQFTLYADCRKGNRPSFVQAAPPALANQLYAHFQAYCKQTIPCLLYTSDAADEL